MIFFSSEDMHSIILYLSWLCWDTSSMSFKKLHSIFVFLCFFSWVLSSIIFSRLWKSTWLWIVYVSIHNISLFFWWIFWITFHSFIAWSFSFHKIMFWVLSSAGAHLELYSSVNSSNFCDFQAVLMIFLVMALICFTVFFQISSCLMILLFSDM